MWSTSTLSKISFAFTFLSSFLQEVKVQSEQGEIYKFALNENGDLPFEMVDALCSGTRAIKYRTNDQTWYVDLKFEVNVWHPDV